MKDLKPNKNDDIKQKEIKLIEMIRDSATNPAPYQAHVHPAEVSNWNKLGWNVKGAK